MSGSQTMGYCEACGLYTGAHPDGRLIQHALRSRLRCEGTRLMPHQRERTEHFYGKRRDIVERLDPALFR